MKDASAAIQSAAEQVLTSPKVASVTSSSTIASSAWMIWSYIGEHGVSILSITATALGCALSSLMIWVNLRKDRRDQLEHEAKMRKLDQ